jgi:predicted methyltransferase
MNKLVLAAAATLALSACEKEAQNPSSVETPSPAQESSAEPAPTIKSLDQILADKPEEFKARYAYRHPKETIEFFGIEPGMTVLEVLPGGGWYSEILAPLLGKEGTIIGADYSMDIWPNFPFGNDEFIEGRKNWGSEWQQKVENWGGDQAPQAIGTTLDNVPAEYEGKVDAILYIRALHNLARFEDKGAFLSQSLESGFKLLKAGGIIGIVQHQSPDDKSDEWADGSRGYLKKAWLIKAFEDAGFEFVSESAINENPLDQPGDDDIVWRLPPGYYTSGDDQEMREKYAAIGESNRMTLLFKKPE